LLHIVDSGTGSGGAISSVTGQNGINVSPTTGAVVVDGGYLAASWPIANTRHFAVDGINGNDANVGYSDTSAADALTKAKKTISALSTIIPREGRGRKAQVLITLGNSSSITGVNGAIRLNGGTIISWANINASGIVDTGGNRIFGDNAVPTFAIPLSGYLLGGAGATTSYMSNTGGTAGGTNATTCNFPTGQRIVNRLRVQAVSNTFTTSVNVTLYKNGAPTALTCAITAGSTAAFSDTAAAHQVLFADNDTFAIVLSNTGDAGKTLICMVTLEGPG
jgi:hypothetical protein